MPTEAGQDLLQVRARIQMHKLKRNIATLGFGDVDREGNTAQTGDDPIVYEDERLSSDEEEVKKQLIIITLKHVMINMGYALPSPCIALLQFIAIEINGTANANI